MENLNCTSVEMEIDKAEMKGQLEGDEKGGVEREAAEEQFVLRDEASCTGHGGLAKDEHLSIQWRNRGPCSIHPGLLCNA